VAVNLGPKEAIDRRYAEAKLEWDEARAVPFFVGTRLSETLVHETGHHLNAAWPRGEERKITPDAEEGMETISAYGWTNSNEYIAESFAGRALSRQNRNRFKEGETHYLTGELFVSANTNERIHEANMAVVSSKKTTLREPLR
jgi:hypothetical protein